MLFLLGYVLIGFLIATVITKFEIFDARDDTDATVGFVLTIAFWPIIAIGFFIAIPLIGLHGFVKFLRK